MTLHYALLDEIPGQARARLRLWGPDTRRFLQGTLTADVESLAPDRAVASGLCTVKGKLVSELVLLPGSTDQEVHALVPKARADALATHFDEHIIMDEVEVEALGPVAAAMLWAEGDDPPAAPAGVDSFVTRHPAPGRLCVGAPDRLAAVLVGHAAAGPAQWAARRIATASPGWGHELQPGFFPPEVGFVYAVSYAKGCFLGQEPLARIHARGQVNRVMVRVRAERSPDLLEGSTGGSAEGSAAGSAAGSAGVWGVELVADDRPGAGRWTTWAPGPEGGALGLAVVRRAVATPGTRLRTAGDDPIEVEVTSDPLGDDPGVGGRRSGGTVKLGGPR